MFVLARKLRSSAGECTGQVFQKAVLAFCERAGQPAEEYWYAFQVCCDKVKLAEGEDVVEWAVHMAEKQPVVTAPTPLDTKYALVGSIAWHLAGFRRPKPFWFPTDRLAGLLAVNVRTIYRIILLLEKNGVIRCVNSDYSFTKGKSREYAYIGPQPDAA
jgi:hypothetical protein